MKFLELHFPGGEPILVNLENVSNIYADDYYGESKITFIYFNGSSDDWVKVIESYDDIVNAIKEKFEHDIQVSNPHCPYNEEEQSANLHQPQDQ